MLGRMSASLIPWRIQREMYSGNRTADWLVAKNFSTKMNLSSAIIKTNFVTNMEPDLIARAVPELFELIKEADTANRAELTRTNPVYKYPPNLQTAASLNYLAHYGVPFAIKRKAAVVVDDLDAMKAYQKTIFGDGLLISDEAAEKAAEAAANVEGSAKNPIIWELSEREKAIIKGLA